METLQIEEEEPKKEVT